jgi:cyclopropane-fatty-acyl-phospholipid synthase
MDDSVLEHGSPIEPWGWLERAARRALVPALARLQGGAVVVRDAEGEVAFGATSADFPEPVHIAVKSPGFWESLLFGGSIGAAESWMRGEWKCTDLTALLRLTARNRAVWDALDGGLAKLATPARALAHWLRRNTRSGSRRNIAAHYDLGNDFFSLFLDTTLTYSCGIFEREDSTLEEASLAKYERHCRKLALRPDDHVLEIGCGWGGFAIHAASHYGVRVTGITLSQAQLELARERVEKAGLSDRVTLRLEDYRDVAGTYDRIVSIEMIEAVGAEHFDEYFGACSARLAPGGAMGLQAIVVSDRDFERSRRGVDFIKRYIFPGGQLPSLGSMVESLARSGDLRVSHVEDLAPHYARTLARWRARVRENAAAIRRLAYPERFLRMWEWYLAYCEAGFAERYLGCLQLVLSKPLSRSDSILGHI